MAGFDPATFWGLTPRLYVARMRAAQKRDAFAQGRTAEAAWMGMHVNQSELYKYIDALTGIDRRLPPEALAGALHLASQHVPVMSRAEFSILKGSRNG